MTDYAKIDVTATYDTTSAYDAPKLLREITKYEVTPTEYIAYSVSAATGGTTVTIAAITTITALVVKNKDTTNFVTAAWTDNAAHSNTQKIPAKGVMVIPDVIGSSNLTLTANGAACDCEVIAWG